MLLKEFSRWIAAYLLHLWPLALIILGLFENIKKKKLRVRIIHKSKTPAFGGFESGVSGIRGG